MNIENSTELQDQLAQYGTVLADRIESERGTTARPGFAPPLDASDISLGSDPPRPVSRTRSLALAGIGLVAASIAGFWVLSSVDAEPDPPATAADGSAAGAEEEEAVGSEEPMPEPENELDESEGSLPVEDPGPPVVTIDIFSGRPNPTIVLTDEEYGELQRVIDSLPEAADAVVPDAGLGFRGFELEPYRYGSAEFSLRVAEDVVVLRHIAADGEPDPDGIAVVLDDQDRAAHGILRSAAEQQIGDLADSIPD